MITPLINIQDVRDSLGLSVNVKERDYNQYIISSQIQQLRELIGDDCATGLEDRTCSNTLTAEDEALLVYVKPYLVHYSYAKYVRPSTSQSTSQGVTKFTGDNTENNTTNEKSNIQQSNEFDAEFYGKKALELIKNNPDDYPCFECEDCCEKEEIGKSIFDL